MKILRVQSIESMIAMTKKDNGPAEIKRDTKSEKVDTFNAMLRAEEKKLDDIEKCKRHS